METAKRSGRANNSQKGPKSVKKGRQSQIRLKGGQGEPMKSERAEARSGKASKVGKGQREAKRAKEVNKGKRKFGEGQRN